MTLDTLLLARALRSAIVAAYLQRALDVQREPTGPADARAIAFWRRVLPLLNTQGPDPYSVGKAIEAAGFADAPRVALAIPAYIDGLGGPTSDLVIAFNSGAGTRWRLPVVRRTAGAVTLRSGETFRGVA